MDDILKEAIADAKALRATALENAKIALEEAFTPRLKSMLSQKIQSEDLPDNEEYGEGRGRKWRRTYGSAKRRTKELKTTRKRKKNPEDEG